MKRDIETTFEETVRGLLAGDFSRLAPLLETSTVEPPCPIIQWFESGRFDNEPLALEEAFTCACFNGRTEVIEYFLANGVNPNGGICTGSNAFHWAADRGHLKAVEILIRHKSALETTNSYGATVLGFTVWSAIHEKRPDHLRIIKALLEAGSEIGASGYPTGDAQIDELLRNYKTNSAR
jgi:Ankyrin repeats (3 copies)